MGNISRKTKALSLAQGLNSRYIMCLSVNSTCWEKQGDIGTTFQKCGQGCWLSCFFLASEVTAVYAGTGGFQMGKWFPCWVRGTLSHPYFSLPQRPGLGNPSSQGCFSDPLVSSFCLWSETSWRSIACTQNTDRHRLSSNFILLFGGCMSVISWILVTISVVLLANILWFFWLPRERNQGILGRKVGTPLPLFLAPQCQINKAIS